MQKEFSFPPGTPAIILSDDYNPVDFIDMWLREEVRKGYPFIYGLGHDDMRVRRVSLFERPEKGIGYFASRSR